MLRDEGTFASGGLATGVHMAGDGSMGALSEGKKFWTRVGRGDVACVRTWLSSWLIPSEVIQRRVRTSEIVENKRELRSVFYMPNHKKTIRESITPDAHRRFLRTARRFFSLFFIYALYLK